MRLIEAHGKQLFAKHGIKVPRGVLWPGLPPGAGQFVIKAQLASGGRGKRGGILFVDGRDKVAEAAERLLGLGLDGERVRAVYVEERLEIACELYLAVTVDRDARCLVVVASPDGGVEIETSDASKLLHVPVDPLSGLHRYHTNRVVRALDPEGEAGDAVGKTVEALYRLAVAEDALLAEINPLVVTPAGELVAADARVILDDAAGFRHSQHAAFAGAEERTAVEAAIAAAGATAVEVDPTGRMVGVVSGAGLMMATLDLLMARGIGPRCMVDLGGTVLRGAEALGPIFSAVARLDPEVVFINAYLQTALCDHVANAFAAAHAKAGLRSQVVFRLKGRNDALARPILDPLGFSLHADLEPAIDAVATSLGGG